MGRKNKGKPSSAPKQIKEKQTSEPAGIYLVSRLVDSNWVDDAEPTEHEAGRKSFMAKLKSAEDYQDGTIRVRSI